MTDNELLLQISNIVTSNSKYLEYRIDQLDEKLTNKIDNLETRLSNRIDELDQRLSSQIAEVDQRLSSQIAEVDQRLSFETKQIRINLETNIEPRLQTIEACYVDTNRRHNANIEKIGKIETDVEVVKSVLQDHIAFINQQTA